jgi:hypothetical protein
MKGKIMKAPNLALALGGALALSAATAAPAEEGWSETLMRPLMATSLNAGGAHVTSYFEPANGACRLTMMIADKDDERVSPTRVQMTIEPGRAAYVDDTEGKSSRFTCLYRAEAMNVVRVERLALAQNR